MSSINNEGNAYLDYPVQIGDDFEIKAQAGSVSDQLDTHAQGSWARVVGVRRRNSGEIAGTLACKVMRFTHRTSAVVHDMFVSELRALREFEKDGFAPRPVACGYLSPPAQAGMPVSDFQLTSELWPLNRLGKHFSGGTESTRPWLPFIIMENIPFENTMLHLAQNLTNYERNDPQTQIMPVWEFLDIAEQALKILVKCQEAGFYYIDHKLEHTVFQNGRVRFIDWNGGPWLSPTEKDSSSTKSKSNTDFMNLTAVVLYPLLCGQTINGNHPLTQYNGMVSGITVKFEEDGFTPVTSYSSRSVLDQRLLKLLGKALLDDFKKSYASPQEYLEAIQQYRELLEKEWPSAYRKMQKLAEELRGYQQGIEDVYQTLTKMTRQNTQSQINSATFKELIRLQQGVVRLRKNGKVISSTN